MKASSNRPQRLCLAVCLCLISAAVFVAAANAAPINQLRGTSMGTTWSLTWVPTAQSNVASLRAAIEARLDTVDLQMSTWKTDSALSRFNRAAPGTWHTLPTEFWQVLLRALALSEASDGAYDPSVGPLVDLWGFGPVQRPRQPPSAAAIKAAMQQVGWHRIKLDASQRRILQSGGIQLDLSSVAKGFAVDEVAEYLLQIGIENFLIELGGELRAHGQRVDGGAWRVGVERPDAAFGAAHGRDEICTTLHLRNEAVTTSGDYRHRFTDDARTYSHHIDPRSGYPVQNRLASVTVVADTALYADPIGTTMMVLGVDAGMALAREHDLAVLFLLRTEGGVHSVASPAFRSINAAQPGHRRCVNPSADHDLCQLPRCG